MAASKTFLSALVLFVTGTNLYGQAVASSTIPRYPGIRTQFNQALSQSVTNEHRLVVFRQTYGQRPYFGPAVPARLTVIPESVRLLGMGAFSAYDAVQQLENDLADFGSSHEDWLKLGDHAIILVEGSRQTISGMALLARQIPGVGNSRRLASTRITGGRRTISGTTRLARQIPSLANSSRLVSFAKWGGIVGVAGTVLVEGFLVDQYLSGELTERQFWHGQASLGGGLAGGAAGGIVGLKAGAASGALLGSLFGPGGTVIGAGVGGTIGAIGGGIGGGYAGANLAGRSVENVYRVQDSEQAERYAQFLLRHYQSP